MDKLKLWIVVLICFSTNTVWADISPISLTLFGQYGEPVYPPALAVPAPNAFGFNILGEWNATSYCSFGLGFEQTTFYGAPDFTTSMLNFEGRAFPLENEKGKFSPYVYGGVGLNLASPAVWHGPVQLKAGIGSRIALIPPLFLDVAVGSHWIQPPNAFQYVDIRSGLSLSFGFKDKASAASKPAEKPLATTTPISTANSTPSPVGTPQIIWTPMPTPILEVQAAPVTTLAQVKKYYRLGMKAFGKRNYKLALKMLKRSLGVKEIHKAAYYYAETYATIGVIYQFHASKVKDHDLKALDNYKRALRIDPSTKSAKTYYKKLKAKVAKQNKAKAKVKPENTPLVLSVDISSPDSSTVVSSETAKGNNPAQAVTPVIK